MQSLLLNSVSFGFKLLTRQGKEGKEVEEKERYVLETTISLEKHYVWYAEY